MYTALHEDAAAMGRVVEVGIVKDLFQFHAYRWYNVLDHLLAWLCDKLFNQVRDSRIQGVYLINYHAQVVFLGDCVFDLPGV